MTANEQLRDVQIRHALDLLKYGNGVERDTLLYLNKLSTSLASRLAGRLILIKERGLDIGPATTARIEAELVEVKALIEGVYSKIGSQLSTDFGKLAGNEAEFHANALSRVIPATIATRVPSPALLRAIVNERPIMGRFLNKFVTDMAAGTVNRVQETVRIGMGEGIGVEAIVRRIVGGKNEAGVFEPGEMEKSRTWARAVVRTCVNHVANETAQATWKANESLIKGWQFIGTLDSRTTPICASLDGQVFKVGEGPRPPRHVACRSITIAITKSFEELGLNKKDYTPEQRASIDGQVPASLTFEKWLRDQSEDRQNAVLGKARADLWRAGKFELRDFIRDNSQVISLDDLKARNPKAVVPQSPVTIGERRDFSPINPDITDATVAVVPRLAVQKALTGKFSEAARDPRYRPRSEFRGRSDADFGKAVLSNSFSDDAASMVAALQPEIEAICDAFNIPRLRGYKATTAAHASMGDGVMALNPNMFNGYAAKIGKPDGSLVADLEKKRDEIRATVNAINARIAEARAELGELRRNIDPDQRRINEPRVLALIDQVNALFKEYNAAIKPLNKVNAQLQAAKKTATPISTWKVGDDIAKRPELSTYYFDGIDKARSVMYHEMGHHVHQMTRKVLGLRVKDQPVEAELRNIYGRKFSGIGAEARAERAKQVSNYATSDQYEFFAENFAMYMMGRMDLVDQDAKELIERLLNEARK